MTGWAASAALCALLGTFDVRSGPPPQPQSETAARSEAAQTPKKRIGIAAAECVGLNLGFWAFDHYVKNRDYTYISWETIRDNFRDGFTWDRSTFFVNFYNHPAHGSMSFNAGRANGLSYLGSALTAFGSSLMWEMVMESQRPSYNDLITTTLGGSVLGETFYRFSSYVRKSEARGFDRFWREAVGAVLDPVGGLNRLFNGRNDSVPGLPGSPDANAALGGEVSLAAPLYGWRSDGLEGPRATPIVEFALDYRDRAAPDWGGKPFDVFSVRGRLREEPDKPSLSLSIGGILAGRLLPSPAGSGHFVAIRQHYEYYGFETLRLGGSSFTSGLDSRFAVSDFGRVATTVWIGWMAFGGTDDFYGQTGERRNCNYVTGWTVAVEATLGIRGFELLTGGWRHYGLLDIYGRSGKEDWDILQGRMRLPLWRELGVGIQYESCERRFDFKGTAPGKRRVSELRALVTWQF